MRYPATPCITLNGTAAEAIAYYDRTLGLKPRRILSETNALGQQEIFHAHLANDAFELMLWDVSSALPAASHILLLLSFETTEEISAAYAALAEDGQIMEALGVPSFGGLYAQVTDPFGVTFVLEYSENGRESAG
ncbi:VOC family protein [Exiguobacterium artemiae]|uniref:VOC family protein n=1 Tax=Exiguobacterium artemiae TaxID=340145 RepID=UPI0006861196|nr:VOC family protein [Exiguobacterium sibiricum]